MAIPSLNYKGEATFLVIQKNDRTFNCIQPKHIDKRIFLQENCVIVGVNPSDLVSGAVYNVEVSTFASINDKGYLNFSAYLLNVLS